MHCIYIYVCLLWCKTSDWLSNFCLKIRGDIPESRTFYYDRGWSEYKILLVAMPVNIHGEILAGGLSELVHRIRHWMAKANNRNALHFDLSIFSNIRPPLSRGILLTCVTGNVHLRHADNAGKLNLKVETVFLCSLQIFVAYLNNMINRDSCARTIVTQLKMTF